jgi:saccharopine dehydrogenase-like NADP-dependent oxidoreductase
MKILALGGSGGMGRFAVHSLIKHPQVESILVADLNESAAKKFASTLSEKTSGIGIDVTDKKALERAMNDVDVVINTTGPFFKLAVPILKAAIETKTHYLDICDDWEPTEKMFLLNDEAKAAGITAIIGLGASPGITNMLGLIAMKELDQVSKVYTGWDMSSAQPEEESSQTGVNAAMVHGIEQIIGKVKVFSSGAYKMVRPLEKVTVDYPQLGAYEANIFGHPEAISFPHHYPEIKESLNLMHSNDDSLVSVLKLIRFFIEIKLLSKNMAAKLLTWLEGTQSPDTEKAGVEMLPSVYGYAEGIKDGQKMSVATTFHTEENIDDLSMGEGTSYPLACGVKMLADGVINQTGVHAPESGIINPDLFFDYLSKELPGDISIKPEISKAEIS